MQESHYHVLGPAFLLVSELVLSVLDFVEQLVEVVWLTELTGSHSFLRQGLLPPDVGIGHINHLFVFLHLILQKHFVQDLLGVFHV